MMRIPRLIGLALAIGSLVAAAPAGTDDDPQSYALRIPITLALGSSVQRLAMPAAALAAAQTADLSDVRVFDAEGRSMPIARAAPAIGPARRHELAALPILGAADALTVTGVSLRLDGDGHARVAQIDGTPSDRPAEAMLLGVLFDARAASGSALSLTLDADMPRAQPLSFVVEASTDLKDWRPLAEQVVYRGADDAAIALKLGDAALKDAYLRVTWRATSRLLAPVTVRKAVLLTRAEAAADVSIAAALPPLADAHGVDFALPFASALRMIRIVPTGTDMIVPVRVFGRDTREQPWTLLGSGTAARAGDAGSPPAIALDGGPHRMMRIEAERSSAGFTAAPSLRLGFASRAILFLAAGKPPYVLATGRATAKEAYLPSQSLMTQASGGPVPSATAVAADGALRLEPAQDAGGSRRQMLFWAILLAATALLAAMAWALWKRMAAGSDAVS